MPTMQSLVEIGQRIRQLRGEKNRSQFAEGFFVAPSTLARWETGESQPDLGFLVRLSGAFGVSIEWIVTGNDDNAKNGDFLADHQLGFLDKIDWIKATHPPPEPTDIENDRHVSHRKMQHAEIIECKKKEMADTSAILKVREENADLHRELRDLLRQNGDLRVENTELRARVRDLERELREALKPEERSAPVACAG